MSVTARAPERLEELGGRFRERVPSYANGWYQGERDPETIAARAREVVRRGYRGMKIDPFGAASAEIDSPCRSGSLAGHLFSALIRIGKACFRYGAALLRPDQRCSAIP